MIVVTHPYAIDKHDPLGVPCILYLDNVLMARMRVTIDLWDLFQLTMRETHGAVFRPAFN